MMLTISWKSPWLSPTLLGTLLCFSSIAHAGESSQPDRLASYRGEANTLAQVTSASQFRDVSPQDWAFPALQNLVSEYGCIAGYPDGTYRGDRALTRWEFAAGLNACLQKLESRLGTASFTTQSNTTATISEAGEPLVKVFERAFFHNTGKFDDITDLSGQSNAIFGWRDFRGSFIENQITRDAEVLEAVYKDALEQQGGKDRIVTQDLPNPFDTSLQSNPSYTRTSSSSPQTEVIIQQTPFYP